MSLQQIIETAFTARAQLKPTSASGEIREAVEATLKQLQSGAIRVAEPSAQGWQVNEWVKKAVLLSFLIYPNEAIASGHTNYYDKVPSHYAGYDAARFAAEGVRVVPPAFARRATFIGRGVVLMPSYINIGAYVDAGTMVDTWATVGSCAQIGKNVHLSGGVGIGGVLEPLQATPTIIEDNCFIGARSEIVEGVVVEKGAVISMGVFIGQSTKIYHRETGEITRGRVPAGAVVVPGSLPAADGSHSLSCAVIIKQVDEKTRAKTSINELLRS